ncbi:hypothetical protein DIPPA_00336 [Diplonema papillatum]|nr:hypothetical protein DIPPA_00336 [Diplonema papillatum]
MKAFFSRPSCGRHAAQCARRLCGGAADFAEIRKFNRDLKEKWTVNHSRESPFFRSASTKYWELIPKPPAGSLVLDPAGILQEEDKFRELNDTLLRIQKETGVTVFCLLFGNIGSFTTGGLARKVSAHWSTEDPSGNMVFIVVSRLSGEQHTRALPGAWFCLHPLWMHQHFKKTFKVYFKGKEWDDQLIEYAHDMEEQLKWGKQVGLIREKGRVLPLVFEYWYVVLAALAALVFACVQFIEYYHYWSLRYCHACGKFLEGIEDPKLLYSKMSLGQRKETDLDCVRYALWKCPNESCPEDTSFVEEVKWNSLRNECLICMKCHHRCSHGRRVIGATPDFNNYGEAVNVRTCAFCGYEEAWLSMIPANFGGYAFDLETHNTRHPTTSTQLRTCSTLIEHTRVNTDHLPILSAHQHSTFST